MAIKPHKSKQEKPIKSPLKKPSNKAQRNRKNK